MHWCRFDDMAALIRRLNAHVISEPSRGAAPACARIFKRHETIVKNEVSRPMLRLVQHRACIETTKHHENTTFLLTAATICPKPILEKSKTIVKNDVFDKFNNSHMLGYT